MSAGRSNIDLESAVNDAADMARLTMEFLGKALEFDEIRFRPLNEEERRLLHFAVGHTMTLADRAKAAFYGEEP